VSQKQICPKSSKMLDEKRKNLQNDLLSVVTKNKIPLNIELIDEITEKLLGINIPKKQFVNIGIQTDSCHKTRKLI
jgi:uncharacterized protein YejL (UPF0352 family)